MRKVTTLVMLAALAVAAVAWLPAPGCAATLELTDSGAPSAIVIFPVGEQPNPGPAGLPPVAYNHVIHEKWMTAAKQDCIVCHHTGDPIACTSCHTLEGSPEGNYLTLYRAMHTPNVPVHADGDTPASCVSCHSKIITQRSCAGCHTQLVRNAREDSAWCLVCHEITPQMSREQMQAGRENKLPEQENEQLASRTVLNRKQASYWSPMIAPYKVRIDSVTDTYEPCIFNHRQHVTVLLENIGDNKLASAFHTNPGTVCITCHHNSPATPTPPKCGSCHAPLTYGSNPSRPALTAAFHLQCMNCHKDMNVARPRTSDCTTCHKLRPVAAAETQGDKQ